MTAAMSKPLLSRALLLCIAVTFTAACTTNRFKNLALRDSERYFGTQPGSHALSDYFLVVSDHRLMKFYFLGRIKDRRELIGTVGTFWYDWADYGPRGAAYAVSEDGKRLVYFDEPGIEAGSPLNMKHGVEVANLFSFDADSGTRTLISQDVHRRGTHCVLLPKTFVIFGRVSRSMNIESIAYSTEGVEISLEQRSKRLADGGHPEAICGPL